MCQEQVRDEKDLRGAEHQVDGEEVVGVRAAIVDPEVIEQWPQDGRGQEHVGHDEQLLRVGEQVLERGEQRQVEAHVPVGGVRLEYSSQTYGENDKRSGNNKNNESYNSDTKNKSKADMEKKYFVKKHRITTE